MGDGAGIGRANHGVAQLSSSFVTGRKRLAVFRVLLDRDVRVAVKVGDDSGQLRFERDQRLLRGLQIEPRLIQCRLRCKLLPRQD